MKLADKVAIITGGNTGIGKATAELFARERARICITGRNEERCREVVAEIKKNGGQAIFVIADVRVPDSSSALNGEVPGELESVTRYIFQVSMRCSA